MYAPAAPPMISAANSSPRPKPQIRPEKRRLLHDQRERREDGDRHAGHAERVAERAVFGLDKPFSAWMKHTEATRYRRVTTFRLIYAPSLPASFFGSFFLNISSIRRRHEKAAEHVHGCEHHSERAEELARAADREAGREHRADDHDRRDRVRHRHQRRMQRGRDVPHHVIADVDRQHEDDQVDHRVIDDVHFHVHVPVTPMPAA